MEATKNINNINLSEAALYEEIASPEEDEAQEVNSGRGSDDG